MCYLELLSQQPVGCRLCRSVAGLCMDNVRCSCCYLELPCIKVLLGCVWTMFCVLAAIWSCRVSKCCWVVYGQCSVFLLLSGVAVYQSVAGLCMDNVLCSCCYLELPCIKVLLGCVWTIFCVLTAIWSCRVSKCCWVVYGQCSVFLLLSGVAVYRSVAGLCMDNVLCSCCYLELPCIKVLLGCVWTIFCVLTAICSCCVSKCCWIVYGQCSVFLLLSGVAVYQSVAGLCMDNVLCSCCYLELPCIKVLLGCVWTIFSVLTAICSCCVSKCCWVVYGQYSVFLLLSGVAVYQSVAGLCMDNVLCSCCYLELPCIKVLLGCVWTMFCVLAAIWSCRVSKCCWVVYGQYSVFLLLSAVAVYQSVAGLCMDNILCSYCYLELPCIKVLLGCVWTMFCVLAAIWSCRVTKWCCLSVDNVICSCCYLELLSQQPVGCRLCRTVAALCIDNAVCVIAAIAC
ncbi:hypothetical protein BsWGS_07323 [Bradybaena similaris]